MLQATVQGRLDLFAGRSWKPGDVIPAEIMAEVPQRAIDALVTQKILVLDTEENGAPLGADQRYGQLLAKYDALRERVDASDRLFAQLRDAFAQGGDAFAAQIAHLGAGLDVLAQHTGAVLPPPPEPVVAAPIVEAAPAPVAVRVARQANPPRAKRGGGVRKPRKPKVT